MYSGAPPPVYSLANLDLPLPPLAAHELEGLRALEERVSDITAKGEARTDRMTLLRFLRARKGNVAAAEAYFRKAVGYRRELGLERMDVDWDLEAYERCLAPWWARGGIVGFGLRGQVVGWERFGRCRFPELLKALPWEDLQRLDAVHMVRVLAAFEEDSMRRKVPFVGNTILVLDLEGMGWEYCNPSVLKAYGKLVECRDMLLPATLAHVLVVRAPRSFALAWQLGQKLLDPITRDKVQIAAGERESMAMLRRYMGNETIPAYLGGSLRTNGDPECRHLLGDADGPIPPEALERFQALRRAGGAAGAGAEADATSGGAQPGEADAASWRSDAVESCCVCPRRAADARAKGA